MLDSSSLLPPDFFANPRWPPVQAVTKVTATEADLIEPAEGPEKNASIGDHS